MKTGSPRVLNLMGLRVRTCDGKVGTVVGQPSQHCILFLTDDYKIESTQLPGIQILEGQAVDPQNTIEFDSVSDEFKRILSDQLQLMLMHGMN